MLNVQSEYSQFKGPGRKRADVLPVAVNQVKPPGVVYITPAIFKQIKGRMSPAYKFQKNSFRREKKVDFLADEIQKYEEELEERQIREKRMASMTPSTKRLLEVAISPRI